jgi:hypothetical protein
MKREYALVAAAVAALALAPVSAAWAEDNSEDLFADTTAAAATDSTKAPAAESATAPAATGSSGLKVKFSGTHEFDYPFPLYSSSYNYDGEMKSPAFKNDFGVEIQDGQIKLVAHWALDIMPENTATGGQYESYENGTDDGYGIWGNYAQLKPLENYVSWTPSAFKFAFGYQIFSWGVADKVNPTDNLNPRDFTTGWNADKIPALAVDANYYPTDNLSLEAVFLPYKQASIYPLNFAGYITSSQLTKFGVYSSSSGSNVDYSSLAYVPGSAVAGGKLNYHSSALDFSLSYLYDIDAYYTPEITTTLTTSGYDISSISLDRRRIHRFGADAKTTVGKFGLWFEGCYSLTDNSGSDDYSVRKSNLAYVLGCDTNYGPNDSYYVNIQYIGTWIPGYDSSSASSYTSFVYEAMNNPLAVYAQLASQSYMEEFYERQTVNSLGLETEGLLQGITLNLKWELLDGLLTPQVTAIYTVPFLYDTTNETRYGDLGLNPEIDVKPVDSFHIKLGADLAYAWVKAAGSNSVSLDTMYDKLGIYTPFNNVYLQVIYKWNFDL